MTASDEAHTFVLSAGEQRIVRGLLLEIRRRGYDLTQGQLALLIRLDAADLAATE